LNTEEVNVMISAAPIKKKLLIRGAAYLIIYFQKKPSS